jgi:hypothetical protein
MNTLQSPLNCPNIHASPNWKLQTYTIDMTTSLNSLAHRLDHVEEDSPASFCPQRWIEAYLDYLFFRVVDITAKPGILDCSEKLPEGRSPFIRRVFSYAISDLAPSQRLS